MALPTGNEISSQQASNHSSAAVNFSSVTSDKQFMPLKKRYTKTHQFESTAANVTSQNTSSSAIGGSGIDCANKKRSTSLDSATSGSYGSSLDEEKTPLDFSRPKSVLRPSVIRHGSQPQMCLAYYYLEK